MQPTTTMYKPTAEKMKTRRSMAADDTRHGRNLNGAPLDNPISHPHKGFMADSSFDIVSEINLQEMDNAVTQAQKEIGTRYDFKGTAASVEFDRKGKELTLTADAEPQLEAVRKVVIERMIKRGVEPRAMDPQKIEQATHKTVRQKVKLKSGIDKETAKTIQKQIKDLKLKVNASIQGEALRVTSSKKDDLQAVIAHLRANPPGIPLQFNNYR